MPRPFSKLLFLIALCWGLLAPLLAADEYEIPPAKREHWAWQRPVRLIVPEVTDRVWPQSPIDAFILARLETAGLKPSPRATKEQLIRRVAFDLLGLPPTPEEIDAYVQDTAPDAWERLIDRLLASPHYGERWGRHWLDLARFAETNGYEHDEVRPDAWRYRDYVIAAFNADLPYDRFIQEQLAGDELWPDEPAALIATGFNLLGPDMTDAAEQAQRRLNTLNDMTDTSALVFLGLTVACARCHNHKFEPIPQMDYYRLQAFFEPAAFRRDLSIATPAEQTRHASARAAYEALVQPTREELQKVEEPFRRKLHDAKFAKLSDEARQAHETPTAQRTPAQKELVEKTNRLLEITGAEVQKALDEQARAEHQRLTKELRRFAGKKPAPLPVTMGLKDDLTSPPKTYFLERGERTSRGTEVVAGLPMVLSPGARAAPTPVTPPRPQTSGRRTALARWITDSDNPLTARVLVNRLWQHHFGRGIVATTNDFGLRGERPTHPELLDWLAVEFSSQESGARGQGSGIRGQGSGASGQSDHSPLTAHHSPPWSIKRLHRLMLLSATYQQSTRADEVTWKGDPDNRLFSRMHRQRLEGEAIRDSLLAISGRLNRQMAGPGVYPPLPDEIQPTKAWPVSPDARDHLRRSVYIFARRNLRYPFLESFDLPDSSLSCPKRERSVTAPQALTLLGDKTVADACQALADRLKTKTQSDPERIELAYRLTLGRPPTAKERRLAEEFLKTSPLKELFRALVNLNEFVFLD